MIQTIKKGISKEYLQTVHFLEEKQESMKIGFHKNDLADEIAVIRPNDNEKEHLWKCFSENVNNDIADYILFKKIGSKMVCFIIELKKSKTDANTKKATSQIKSTFPLAKMIYEKTTGENPALLRLIGIRLFGITGSRKQQKLSRKSKLDFSQGTSDGNISIISFSQNRNQEPFLFLNKIFNELSN